MVRWVKYFVCQVFFYLNISVQDIPSRYSASEREQTLEMCKILRRFGWKEVSMRRGWITRISMRNTQRTLGSSSSSSSFLFYRNDSRSKRAIKISLKNNWKCLCKESRQQAAVDVMRILIELLLKLMPNSWCDTIWIANICQAAICIN